MNTRARQIQADTALDLITNYVPDLTEAGGLAVVRLIQKRFGWTGTFFGRSDAESRARELLPDSATDQQVDELVEQVMKSGGWKHMADAMNQTGWEWMDEAFHQFDIMEETCCVCEGDCDE